MVKFGVKEWRDGVVSLVIGDWEMPFREMPKWFKFAMGRFDRLWHVGGGSGYILHYLYLSPQEVATLLGTASREVLKFAEEAIEDVRRRTLRETKPI